MSLDQVEKLALRFATARDALAAHVTELQDELQASKKRHIGAIRKASIAVVDAHAALSEAIGDSAPDFEKPKTRIFHGIKVGFRKGTGKIEWDDDAALVKAIRKHFPDQADVLVKVEETPLKGPISQLSAQDLKRLGISVDDAGEFVYIKAVGGDVEKVVAALLKDAAGLEGSEKAA